MPRTKRRLPARSVAPAPPASCVPMPPVRASMDVAQSDYMSRHWTHADMASPDGTYKKSVRDNAMKRARYEVANNTYAKGIVETLVECIVGTGPRLQMLIPGNPEANRRLEQGFNAWARAVRLVEKLAAAKRAQKVDGESIIALSTNPSVAGPVKLDLDLIESEQLATPWQDVSRVKNLWDGIEYDAYGVPVRYYVVRRKPGETTTILDQYTPYDAARIIHRYRRDRPGQHRGYSELAPALPLFAHLRNYTLSVVEAARTAANFSWILYADQSGEPQELGDAWEEIDLQRGMGMVAPAGYKPHQMKAEQPTANYPQFKREIVNEIARAFNMPYNVAAADSSDYNYASGRLDHQLYFRSIQCERELDEIVQLDPIVAAWWQEAKYLPEYRFIAPVVSDDIPHGWFWDGYEHVDPMKEARAAIELRAAGLVTDAEYFARRGLSVEAVYAQLARERKMREDVGLTDPEAAPHFEPDENEEETRRAKRA